MNVFLAPSSFFGSPAEYIYLNPPIIKRKRAKVPTNIKSAVTIFEKIAGIQLIVATPSLTHSPHSLNIFLRLSEKKGKDKQRSYLVRSNYWNF